VRHLRDDVLGVYLADNVKARHLQADGAYQRPKVEAGQPLVNSQAWLLSHRPWREPVA
jgi:polyphosphate kinase